MFIEINSKEQPSSSLKFAALLALSESTSLGNMDLRATLYRDYDLNVERPRTDLEISRLEDMRLEKYSWGRIADELDRSAADVVNRAKHLPHGTLTNNQIK